MPNLLLLLLALCLALVQVPAAADPLPSWNEGPAKKAILDFVAKVTKKNGPDFVPPSERIAVFDNDGTLWPEQPMYVQLAFALDRVKGMAAQHPEWKSTHPFREALAGDLKALGEAGPKALMEIMMATHAGMTTEQFEALAKGWLDMAVHPRFDRHYTDLAYQPMQEVLSYLRANGFKTFIVSGGGVEFMRPWTEKVYGIPPEQVIGSTIGAKYDVRDGKPEIVRLPEVAFIDDKAGKPVAIHRHIGRRPIAAFGNSDGDFEMLEWTTSGPGPRLGMIVHHDDAQREWAYDRESPFGKLARALDEAPARGWVVADMKKDWRRIFGNQVSAVTVPEVEEAPAQIEPAAAEEPKSKQKASAKRGSSSKRETTRKQESGSKQGSSGKKEPSKKQASPKKAPPAKPAGEAVIF